MRERAADGAVGARALVLVQQRERALGPFGEAPAVGKARVFLGEALELPGGELQRGELLRLVAQQFELRVPVARAASPGRACG